MATLISFISACVSRQNYDVLALENRVRLFHALTLMERIRNPALKPEVIGFIAKTDQSDQLPEKDAVLPRVAPVNVDANFKVIQRDQSSDQSLRKCHDQRLLLSV